MSYAAYSTLAELLSASVVSGQKAGALDAPASDMTYNGSKWEGHLGSLTQAQLNSISTATLAHGVTVDIDSYTLTFVDGWWQQNNNDVMSFTPFRESTLNDKLKSIQNGMGGVFTICCIGESTTKGLGSYNSNPAAGAWVRHFARSLERRTGFYVSEIHIPQSTDGQYDNRWGIGSNWSTIPDGPGCGLISNLVNAATASSVTFTDPAIEWDTATLFYHVFPSGGANSATVQATGGSATAINNYSANRAVASVTVSAGSISRSNVLTVSKQANTYGFYLIGVELYNSKLTARIRVANLGVSGARTSDWTAEGSAGMRGWWPVTYMNPDLCILCLGGNESSGGVPASTHVGAMQTLVSNLPSTSKLALVSITPRTNETQRALVDQYVAGYATLTGSNILNYAPLTWGAWRNVLPPSYSSSVHLSCSGYKWVADVIERVLLW